MDVIIVSSKYKPFLPYSWKIAHLVLYNNHSLISQSFAGFYCRVGLFSFCLFFNAWFLKFRNIWGQTLLITEEVKYRHCVQWVQVGGDCYCLNCLFIMRIWRIKLTLVDTKYSMYMYFIFMSTFENQSQHYNF